MEEAGRRWQWARHTCRLHFRSSPFNPSTWSYVCQQIAPWKKSSVVFRSHTAAAPAAASAAAAPSSGWAA